MSVDFQWDLLDSPLASALVEMLNNQLASAPRPSFIGPIEVTSFDFGTAPPDIELVDMCDIHRDFLEDDDEEDDAPREPVKSSEGADDEDAFEWVPRRASAKSVAGDGPGYHHLPPHVRYGGAPAMDMFASMPSLHSPRHMWPGPLSASAMGSFPGHSTPPIYRPPFPENPFASAFATRSHSPFPLDTPLPGASPISPSPAASPPNDSPAPTSGGPSQPNLQLHMRINWASNLRLTLTTSLLINYPSPMFMSLPIKLSVTGLIFSGELVVAYEGERKRVHLCVLDDLDPYGPVGDRVSAPALSRNSTHESLTSTSDPDQTPEDEDGLGSGRRRSKPLPVGQRLLPSIFIESEIGQADKHVLKNVTRVERFIQDVIRKTIEEELVFPNFHTVVLAE